MNGKETDMRDNKGRFAAGNTGRPKGIKNSKLALFKKELKGGLIDRLPMFFQLLDSPDISDKDRINAYLKALEFVMPKQTKIDIDSENSPNILEVKFLSTGVKPITSEADYKQSLPD